VRRYGRRRRKAMRRRNAYLPLEFDPGQDGQIDWTEGVIEIARRWQPGQHLILSPITNHKPRSGNGPLAWNGSSAWLSSPGDFGGGIWSTTRLSWPSPSHSSWAALDYQLNSTIDFIPAPSPEADFFKVFTGCTKHCKSGCVRLYSIMDWHNLVKDAA